MKATPHTPPAPGRDDIPSLLAGMGARIRDNRRAQGLSQEELAKQIGGAGQSRISEWEQGRSAPSESYLTALAELFDVSPGYLRYGEGRPRTPELVGGIIDGGYICQNLPADAAIWREALGAVQFTFEAHALAVLDDGFHADFERHAVVICQAAPQDPATLSPGQWAIAETRHHGTLVRRLTALSAGPRPRFRLSARSAPDLDGIAVTAARPLRAILPPL